MPKLIHKPPAYSLHRPSNRARVRYGGKENGLPGLRNSPASHRAYADLLEELRRGGPSPAVDQPPEPALCLITIAELIERFWVHARRYYRKDGKPTGEHVTIRPALRPLLRLHGRLLAVQFKPSHLKQVRQEMIGLDWSRRYLNDSVRRVKRMFNWATEEELIPPEIAGALAKVRGLQEHRTEAREKPAVGAVADEVVDATLPHVSEVFADSMRAMRHSGMRPGESIRIKVEEIDRSDPECWRSRPGRHKTEHRGKVRTVFVGPRCQAILSPWIVKARGGRIFPVNPQWAPDCNRHPDAERMRLDRSDHPGEQPKHLRRNVRMGDSGDGRLVDVDFHLCQRLLEPYGERGLRGRRR